MYTATYAMNDLGKFDTFKEAFKAIYDKIREDQKAGKAITVMELESATWIKRDASSLPCMFCEARDRACDSGWIREGKWVD